MFFCNIFFTDYTTTHLVDGPSPNVGRVQVQYDDALTDVCFEGNGNDESWTYDNLANLKVLCRQLGYPGYLMTSSITAQNSVSVANVFTDDYKCREGKRPWTMWV